MSATAVYHPALLNVDLLGAGFSSRDTRGDHV
jgi:hypothetical protein